MPVLSVENAATGRCIPILTGVEDVRTYVADKFEAFIFDMDGVVWRTDAAVLGVSGALSYLRSLGKKIFFCTNNSMKSRNDFVLKLRRLGMGDFAADDIFASSFLSARVLKNLGYQGKVFVVGPDCLKSELADSGFEVVDPDILDRANTRITPEEMARYPVDTSIGAVVVGFDYGFNYFRMAYATILCNNRDCLFVITNEDLVFPTSGFTLPGTGSFTGVVERATGRRPIIAGKPGSCCIDLILERYPELTRDKICMIGDNIFTDIAFGNLNNIGTVLVETGIHNRNDLVGANPNVLPQVVMPSAALLDLSAPPTAAET